MRRTLNLDTFRAAERRRYSMNPAAFRAAIGSYRDRVRAEVFGHYGDACACCGRVDLLTIDHLTGSGAEHRRELFGSGHAGGVRFYAWLIRQDFPVGYQTLCQPCNTSKGNGECCRLEHGEVLSTVE
jgi:hypothetical protein